MLGIDGCKGGWIAVDDLLDAMAAWWTAGRMAEGVAEAEPAEPEFDSRGLAMQVWR